MRLLTLDLSKKLNAELLNWRHIVIEAENLCDFCDLAYTTYNETPYDAVIVDFTRLFNERKFSPHVVREVNKTVLLIGVYSGDTSQSTGAGAIFLRDGGDHFLRAPVSGWLLQETLSAAVRRLSGYTRNIRQFLIDGDVLEIDFDQRTVCIGGEHIHLTQREYGAFELLARRPGMVFTVENFLDQLYSGDDEPDSNCVKVFISKLRKKLENAHPGMSEFIETIWGRGWRLPKQGVVHHVRK